MFGCAQPNCRAKLCKTSEEDDIESKEKGLSKEMEERNMNRHKHKYKD